VGSEYLFGDFLRLSAFSFNAPPAKSFTVLHRVAVAGKMPSAIVARRHYAKIPRKKLRKIIRKVTALSTSSDPPITPHNPRSAVFMDRMAYNLRGQGIAFSGLGVDTPRPRQARGREKTGRPFLLSSLDEPEEMHSA
jgi:hypothetical protein